MEEAIRKAIEANLFAPARAAVGDWDTFPWHRGRNDSYHVAKRHSSQALAIDVFGTIKASRDCDLVMVAVAERLGLPGRGPCSLDLEWDDRSVNRLREPRPTQIDAVAWGGGSLIFFECKFTEKDGGACSQTQPVREGAHEGLRQCNGNYIAQRNPVNGKSGRCALSGKDVAYWEVIPKVFRIAADQDHRPCPFTGPWFQWMRNLVLCHEITAERRLRPAFVVVYADAIGLPLAEKARGEGWGDLTRSLRPGVIEFRSVSFQGIVNEACRATCASRKPIPTGFAVTYRGAALAADRPRPATGCARRLPPKPLSGSEGARGVPAMRAVLVDLAVIGCRRATSADSGTG